MGIIKGIWVLSSLTKQKCDEKMAQCGKCRYKMEFLIQSRKWYCPVCETYTDEKNVAAPTPPPYPKIGSKTEFETVSQTKFDTGGVVLVALTAIYICICCVIGYYFIIWDMLFALLLFIIVAISIPIVIAFEAYDFEIIIVIIICSILLFFAISGSPILDSFF